MLCTFADLFVSVEETSEMASSLVNSGGVCFVPSFSGLQVKILNLPECILIPVKSTFDL